MNDADPMVVRIGDVGCAHLAPRTVGIALPAEESKREPLSQFQLRARAKRLYILSAPAMLYSAKSSWERKISFGADDLHNAGHYVAILVGGFIVAVHAVRCCRFSAARVAEFSGKAFATGSEPREWHQWSRLYL